VISRVHGQLMSRNLDRVEILTAGGLAYEVHIPLGVVEKLPAVGEQVLLHTHLVVKEDDWQLYGFGSIFEREVFRRILLAKGVGPGLALGMLSALTAERVVRAIQEKDIALLITIPRIGRKKAEQIVLDLADKMDDAYTARDASDIAGRTTGAVAEDAIRAMMSLGFSTSESERAVRAAMDELGRSSGAQGDSAAELIKRALAHASGTGRG
jgi:Holliday junction DNA helicase RuvA